MKLYIFVISLLGLLFSGFLSLYKIFNKSCAFGESCPSFLGYPACYFGFAMYLMLAILSYLLLGRSEKLALKGIIMVSLMGIFFAGYFTLNELPVLFEKGFSAYFFGLPTCALGLIFYFLIFVFSVKLYITK